MAGLPPKAIISNVKSIPIDYTPLVGFVHNTTGFGLRVSREMVNKESTNPVCHDVV